MAPYTFAWVACKDRTWAERCGWGVGVLLSGEAAGISGHAWLLLWHQRYGSQNRGGAPEGLQLVARYAPT